MLRQKLQSMYGVEAILSKDVESVFLDKTALCDAGERSIDIDNELDFQFVNF